MKQYIDNDGRRTSLSHCSILAVQEHLLQPGFHVVRGASSFFFQDVVKAHGLAQPFLRGAMLTTDERKKLFAQEMDLIKVDQLFAENLDFLLQYDFLVIDGTRDLLRAAGYGRFEQLLIDYGFFDRMPVIMIFSA